MSEAFYDSMAATASKLITKFGAAGDIKRTTLGCDFMDNSSS